MLRKLKVIAEFSKEYEVGWLGYTIRGVLGYVLREAFCIAGGKCSRCYMAQTCPTAYLFETSPSCFPPAYREIASKASGITKPYVLEPQPAHGKTLAFNMTLIGNARKYEGILPRILERAGEIGLGRCPKTHERRKYTLLEIKAYNPYTKEEHTTYSRQQGYNPTPNHIDITEEQLQQRAKQLAKPNITIKLETPLRLVLKNRLMTKPKLHHLTAHLARKYSLIRYYHLQLPPITPKEAKAMTQHTRKNTESIPETAAVKLTRYSIERNRPEQITAITGRIKVKLKPEFQGKTAEKVLKLLALAEQVHAGKLTTAGLGKITIS